MALENVLQRARFPSHFPQGFYFPRHIPPHPNAMDYASGSNESSEYEGFRNPSSRSSTGLVVMDPMYPASHATEIDSLRPSSTACNDSAPKYLHSKGANGFNTNVSSSLNASNMEIRDPTSAPTFFEGPNSYIFSEPEAIHTFPPPNVHNFEPFPSEWPPLNNSLHAVSSVHDNYSTDFATWLWPGTSSECSVREASETQPRYLGAMMDNNKIDAPTQSQGKIGQAEDDSTLRCQEIGCGKSFSRTNDLKRHHRELHDPGQKRFLCGCCSTKPDGFKREDKLINHKVKFHDFTKGSKPRTCPECSEANTLDILYFCSDGALESHRKLAHGTHAVASTPTGCNDIQSETINATKIRIQFNEGEADTILPESSSKPGKRGHQIENENSAKKLKLDLEVHQTKGQRMEIMLKKLLTVDSQLGNDSENASTGEILVPHVGISDFIALAKDKVIRALEEKINSAGGLAKPEISFNAFQGSIRLRGFGSISEALLLITVADLLGKRKRLGSSLNDFNSLDLLCMRSKMSSMPRTQPVREIKIFAMRHREDAELLKVWHERIIPALPALLTKTIGDNYSASLVRKGTSELSGKAVIQIQCHTLPSRAVRSRIRKEIVCWTNKDISLTNSQVQFLKGHLTTLAGELDQMHELVGNSEQEDEGSDDEGEHEYYPFYKRYWRTPGPGASIGLLCTGSIAATICCYVHVEERLYILTVKHFVTKSYDRLLTGASDKTTVVSPALADVDDMREQFTQFVTNFTIELEDAMREHFGDEYPEYVPFSDMESLPDNVQDIMAKLEIVRKDLSHLTEGDGPFRLGSLEYQSTTPSDSDQPLLSRPEQSFGHHMDWALCSVHPQRVGTNRHRYHYDPAEEAVDFYTGDTETFGAGPLFPDTCVVEPNTKVHFVGQATGRQSGEINAARILIRHNGIDSEEWAMVMANNGQDGSDNIHRGDSGASIVRDIDSKLVGLLWARTKDGQLVLTPINAVFDDIRQKLQATEVSLPRINPSSRPQMPLSTIAHEVDTICRDKTIERSKPSKQFRSSYMPSPRRKPLPASSMPERVPPRNIQPPITKTASLPTPLPGSQLPPMFNPPKAMLEPVLPDPASIHLAQQFFRALEDNTNKHSLAYILTGYSNSLSKLEKRSTFPLAQGRALHRTGTWPAKSHLRFGSVNAGALNAISVN